MRARKGASIVGFDLAAVLVDVPAGVIAVLIAPPLLEIAARHSIVDDTVHAGAPVLLGNDSLDIPPDQHAIIDKADLDPQGPAIFPDLVEDGVGDTGRRPEPWRFLVPCRLYTCTALGTLLLQLSR